MKNAMPVLNWRQAARADLAAIVSFIADDNPDAAQQLKDDIVSRATNLLKHPQMYPTGRIADTREMVVRSNYVVVYTEREAEISILRVLHAAQQWPE